MPNSCSATKITPKIALLKKLKIRKKNVYTYNSNTNLDSVAKTVYSKTVLLTVFCCKNCYCCKNCLFHCAVTSTD